MDDDVTGLLQTARRVYRDDPVAHQTIGEIEARWRDPLRVAVAGMVKAGKSTLLNAMLGEKIAPTDAGECTRVVTWYRYSATPTITLHPKTGQPRRMPVARVRGHLVLELGGVPAEDVAWIDVGWPLEGLRSMILIDTPGIASLSEDTSARAARFLTPDEAPSAADAVIYLMRHLHASDVKFLEAFRDTAAGAGQTICAVGVLSRADEIGSGRIDALLSAGKVARRYEQDADLAPLVLGVLPVAGLVAEAARTLRESEFIALRELARVDRRDRELLLVSADRFTSASAATSLSPTVRADLLARFGIFGVRLATALIRGGVANSSELAQQMVQQSGLIELQHFVRSQFRTRATALKLRGVLLGVGKLIDDRPRAGVEEIAAALEHLAAGAHPLRELSLLAKARGEGLPLSPADAADAERIIGAAGTSARARLGLPEGADVDAVRDAVRDRLDHWHRVSASPLTGRAAIAVCGVVIRSLEAVASEVGPARPDRSTPDVVLSRGPGDRLR